MNKKKGFTLIELLVVVAIIGILAVVGVVAYNGYTSSAKATAIKLNHATVVKKLNLLMQECNLNQKVNLKKEKNNNQNFILDCYYDMNPTWLFGEYFKNDMNNNIKWKNPYNTSIMGIDNYVLQQGSCYGASMNDYVGFSHIQHLSASQPGDKRVSVCTCFQAPCTLLGNRIEYYASFD